MVKIPFILKLILIGIFTFSLGYFGSDILTLANKNTQTQTAQLSTSFDDIWCSLTTLFGNSCHQDNIEYAITPEKEEKPTPTVVTIIKNTNSTSTNSGTGARVSAGQVYPTTSETIKEVIIKDQKIDTTNFITRTEYDRQVDGLLRSIEDSNESSSGSSGGGGGSGGTVTSVDITTPTALTTTGGPITTSGTFALSLTPGYTIPLTASTTEWDNAANPAWGAITGTLSNQTDLQSALDAKLSTTTAASSYLNVSSTTDDITEGGTNKYWTQSRFDTAITSTSSLPHLSVGTSTVATSLSGTITESQISDLGSYLVTTNNLSDLSSTTVARTNLGLGSLATLNDLSTFSTTNLSEGTNLYFTTERASTTANQVLSATTTLPNLTTLANLTTVGTITSGVWNGTAIGDTYLTKTGNWTGTFDGQEGSYYLSRSNHTGTQLLSTISDAGTLASLNSIDISDNSNLSVSATGLELSGDAVALSSGYTIPLTASTTEWATAYGWGDHSTAGYIDGTGTSTFTGDILITGDIVPSADNTYSLGTPGKMWKDVYIGPGSLYINGQKVLQEDSDTIVVSADLDQNLRMESSGIGSATVRAKGTGNALLSATSTGNVNISSLSGNISINSTSGNLNLGTTGSGQLNLGTIDSGVWNGTAIDISDYTNLSVSATGLELSGDAIALSSGYTIPLTASTTEWANKVSSQWTTSGSDIYYNSGNVGIGDAAPGSKLDVAGDINISDTAVGYKIGDNTVLYASSTNQSTLVGINAGQSLIGTATGNTALGQDALYTATSSINNTAVGYQSLRNNTSGTNNTATGYFSMRSNTTGKDNSAFSYASLFANTTGNYNTAVGSYALRDNTVGTNNTALGYLALYSNTTGSFNVANGSQAGRYLTNGFTIASTTDYSVFLGSDTKALTANDQNTIVIGYNAEGLGSNTVVLGNDSITTTALKGNVGVGTTSPSSKLHVYSGSSGGATANGGADELILENSANAGLTIATPNTNIGTLRFADPENNSVGRITYNHNDDDLSFWTNASERLTLNSSGNVGIGTTSPQAPLHVFGSNGSSRALVLQDNSGDRAGIEFQDDTGTATWIVDAQGTGSGFRIAEDSTALSGIRFQIDPGGNVGIGNTSPNELLVVGDDIGNITASNALVLGASGTDNTQFFIGNDSSNFGNIYWDGTNDDLHLRTKSNGGSMNTNQLVLDSSGNVGIGTMSPSTQLHIADNDNVTLTLESTNDSNEITGINFLETSSLPPGGFRMEYDGSSNSFAMGWLTSGTFEQAGGALSVHSSGKVGIGVGTTTPQDVLDVRSTGGGISLYDTDGSGSTANAYLRFFGSDGVRTGYVGDGSTGNANIILASDAGDITVGGSGGNCTLTGAASGGTCFSDERLKNINSEITDVLDSLATLDLKTFYWNETASEVTGAKTDFLHTGFIAQQVESVFPELVYTNNEGYKTLDYGTLSMYSTAAIKELNFKLEDLATTTDLYAVSGASGESFAARFFERLIAWLGSAGNGIASIFVNEKICIDGECLTAEDVRALKASVGSSGTASGGEGSDEGEDDTSASGGGGSGGGSEASATSTDDGSNATTTDQTSTSTDDGTNTSTTTDNDTDNATTTNDGTEEEGEGAEENGGGEAATEDTAGEESIEEESTEEQVDSETTTEEESPSEEEEDTEEDSSTDVQEDTVS